MNGHKKSDVLQQAAEDMHSIQAMCMSYGNEDRQALEALRKRIYAFVLESLERLYDSSGICPKDMSFGRPPTGHPRFPFSTVGTKQWRVRLSSYPWMEKHKESEEVIKASTEQEAKRHAELLHPDMVPYECVEIK